MKIRLGFVSNSSSSSFVCEVSGTVLTGYNGEYDELTAQCDCGHEFLAEYLLPSEEIERDISTEGLRADLLTIFENDEDEAKTKLIQKADEETISELSEDYADELESLYESSDEGYDIPSSRCPLCQFKEIQWNDLANYLMTKHNEEYENVLNEIKNKFKTYKDFQEYIKSTTPT